MDIYSIWGWWSASHLPIMQFWDLYRDWHPSEMPLHVAAYEGRLEDTIALIERGADIEGLEQGMTPLHFAALGGRVTAIRALIKAGADVNAKYRLGSTPLEMAKASDHAGAITVISKAGGTGRNRFQRFWRRPDR